MDKAGGFDIEGLGSVFIHRIEGCYSNVIGLPMAKLTSMLKKVGVSILGLLITINLIGCATEYNLATKEEESLMYGTEKEVKIGEAFAQKVEKEYPVITDVDVNERVERVLNRIVPVCDRHDIVFFIKVLDKDIMNAVSLPGGYIYVFKRLLDKVDNDDQLAGVIAHEVGHITAKHGVKKLQASYAALLAQVAAIKVAPQAAAGVGVAITSLFMEHSQADEFQADQLGVKYMKKAGYNPSEMLNLLQKLKAQEEKEPIRPYSYWRTHPYIAQRIAAVNQSVTGKIEFSDYLNLIGNEK